MEKGLISVIVPVYNVENVLSNCVESILRQSYPAIEIILVDDGSSDNSGLLCDDYAAKHSKVSAYHKVNGGQSSARNLGLRYARGEFVGFIDSDDYIGGDMYSYLWSLIDKHGADAASISIKAVYDLEEKAEQPKESIVIKDGLDILHHFMEVTTKSDGYSVCRCLFKKSLLEKYPFREGHFYEDIDYKFAALSQANRFVDSNQIYYYYLQTQDSTSFAPFKSKDYDLVLASNILLDLCKETGDSKLIYYADVKKARTPFSLLFRIAYMGFADGFYTEEEQRKIIMDFVSQLRGTLWVLLKSPIKVSRKFMAVLLCINYDFVRFILTLYHKLKNRKLIRK